MNTTDKFHHEVTDILLLSALFFMKIFSLIIFKISLEVQGRSSVQYLSATDSQMITFKVQSSIRSKSNYGA